ncbi:MAG: S49 family peptidase [Pseudomonadota bacterium]
MNLFRKRPTIPVIRLSGVIAAGSMRSGISIGSAAPLIEKAFKAMGKEKTVAVVINSPGGSPVQSNLVMRRIRALADEKDAKVLVFVEDVAASGGYFIAIAGDEIFADPSSVVGSIGVISAQFGLQEAIAKLGIERRVYTAGESKSMLDPFKEAQSDDIARLRDILEEIHTVFIDTVKERRGDKLIGADSELFEGQVWVGRHAVTAGLIDGLSDVRTELRRRFGKKVRMQVIGRRQSLFSRQQPGVAMPWDAASVGTDGLGAAAARFAPALLDALEDHTQYQRFGVGYAERSGG